MSACQIVQIDTIEYFNQIGQKQVPFMVQLSTKKAGEVLGVSEATVKRLCDRGEIQVQRTLGGHRRIKSHDLIQFARRRHHPIVNADLLGLPGDVGSGKIGLENAAPVLISALISKNEQAFRLAVFDLYLSGLPLFEILDKALTPVLHEVLGKKMPVPFELDLENPVIAPCANLLNELLDMVPQPQNGGRRAMGGALMLDAQQLPARMAELVLREQGWQTITSAEGFRVGDMITAIQHHKPEIFWLSFNWIEDDMVASDAVALLNEACRLGNSHFVVVGKIKPSLPNIAHFNHFTDMATHLGDVRGAVS